MQRHPDERHCRPEEDPTRERRRRRALNSHQGDFALKRPEAPQHRRVSQIHQAN